MREFPTILDLIGHTPIIRLPQMQPPGSARVLAKLEYVNPGGSIKDRIALPMIEAAERDGRLQARRHDRRGDLAATRASASRWSRRSAATAASS